MEDAVLEQVDRNRIVELACNLANIVSITGEEEEVAKYLGGEFEKLGMEVEYQYIEAVAALQKAGVKLKGDLIIAGVVGEIEKAQVGRFQGKTYRGAGVGARYLMDPGVMADMCIGGEATGMPLAV